MEKAGVSAEVMEESICTAHVNIVVECHVYWRARLKECMMYVQLQSLQDSDGWGVLFACRSGH